MLWAVRFSLLGRRPTADPNWFNAFDAAVELNDGSVVCLGARTPEALNSRSHPDVENQPWGPYRPIPVTLDFATVDHYDFNTVFWLGPEPRPCLFWTNALALTEAGVATILRHDADGNRGTRLIDGRDGRGLPDPAEVGVEIAATASWIELQTPP